MPYALWLRPAVHDARRRLPGHVRQRMVRLIDSLADDPRPHRSRSLNLPQPPPVSGWEVRRARMHDWRVVYAVNDDLRRVAVLGVWRRPPYDYDDLATLLAEL